MNKKKKLNIELTPDLLEKKSKKKLYLWGALIFIVIIILISIGASVWVFLNDKKTQPTNNIKLVKSNPVSKVYYNFEKSFFIQFEKKDKFNFITISVTLLIRSKKIIPTIKKNLPLLRHSYINILSKQSGRNLLTIAGKRKLKLKLKEIANNILEQNDNLTNAKPIEGVLLTEFVIQ